MLAEDVVFLTAANILASFDVSEAAALDGSAPKWSGGTVKYVLPAVAWSGVLSNRVAVRSFTAGLSPSGAPSGLVKRDTRTLSPFDLSTVRMDPPTCRSLSIPGTLAYIF